jgi:membrane protein YqaA with SNARE-associated domain
MGSEALFVYDLSEGLDISLLLIVATLGNTLGSVINYWFGLKGEEFLIEKKIIKYQKIDSAKLYFDKYGGYSLLLAWVPIIGDPIVMIAGILRYNFFNFLILVTISKASRYIFIAYFMEVA